MLHHFIKAWATHRGVFSSEFGYLGDSHITLMLSRVFKMLPDIATLSSGDILCTFFHHYSLIDWCSEVVYDPFFHKEKPKYRRALRESMVLLSLHNPIVNVARTASKSTVRTIASELKGTAELLRNGSMTWTDFVGITLGKSHNGDAEFLTAYSSYIKINVQYWGLSLSKGCSFLSWLESRCLLLLAGKLHRI